MTATATQTPVSSTAYVGGSTQCQIVFGTNKTANNQLLFATKPDHAHRADWNPYFNLKPQFQVPQLRLMEFEKVELIKSRDISSVYTRDEMLSILFFSQKNQIDDRYLWQRIENKDKLLVFFSSDSFINGFHIDGLHRLYWDQYSFISKINERSGMYLATNTDSLVWQSRPTGLQKIVKNIFG